MQANNTETYCPRYAQDDGKKYPSLESWPSKEFDTIIVWIMSSTIFRYYEEGNRKGFASGTCY